MYQPPSVLLVTAAFHCLSYEATVPSLGFSRSIDLDRVGTATEGPGPPPRELVSISLLHSCYMLRAAGSSFVAAQCQVCENSGYSKRLHGLIKPLHCRCAKETVVPSQARYGGRASLTVERVQLRRHGVCSSGELLEVSFVHRVTSQKLQPRWPLAQLPVAHRLVAAAAVVRLVSTARYASPLSAAARAASGRARWRSRGQSSVQAH